MHKGKDYDDVMEEKIKKFMEEKYRGIKDLMSEAWLNVSTYFTIKKRGRISFYTLKKFAEIGLKL